MSTSEHYEQKLAEILAADPRYRAGAYEFVREAVGHTVKRRRKKTSAAAKRRHISGQELLDGIRELALQQFGPLAFEVFDDWGVHKTEDFGQIVFNLVGQGLLAASKRDSPLDFRNGYDFSEAFVAPFVEGDDTPIELPIII